MVNNLDGLRMSAFGLATFLSLLTIGLGAAAMNYTIFNFRFYFIFVALGVAAAGLTFLTLPLMFYLSRYRKGAFTSIVVVEAVWTLVLWVLWLAAGASSASSAQPDVCFIFFEDFFLNSGPVCPEIQALTAFEFLAFSVLFGYNVNLIVLAFRQQMRGHPNIWTGNISETDFYAPALAPAPAPSSFYSADAVSDAKEVYSVNTMNTGNVHPHQYPPSNGTAQRPGYTVAGAQPTMTPVPEV